MSASPGAVAHGRASGKVILLGEHAVVYGAPALAAGIDRGARADAERLAEGAPSRLHLAGASDGTSEARDELDRALAALLAHEEALPPVSVTAELDVPPYAGLGSSAALGVAIARAAAGAAGRVASDAEAIARATAWERTFHGNPSGIDTTAAAIGGCFRFTRADGARSIAPERELTLCIGQTGVLASTREMVEGLARLRGHKPAMVDKSIAAIAALVENAVVAIDTGDLASLGKLMDLNQMLLAGLMLSTETIEELCGAARRAGALGAKLTGKGGGGSVLALVPDRAGAEAVLEAWRSAGYQGFSTHVPARTTTP
jgi:mevalonate kinase